MLKHNEAHSLVWHALEEGRDLYKGHGQRPLFSLPFLETMSIAELIWIVYGLE